jgi:hypothetical protein
MCRLKASKLPVRRYLALNDILFSWFKIKQLQESTANQPFGMPQDGDIVFFHVAIGPTMEPLKRFL